MKARTRSRASRIWGVIASSCIAASGDLDRAAPPYAASSGPTRGEVEGRPPSTRRPAPHPAGARPGGGDPAARMTTQRRRHGGLHPSRPDPRRGPEHDRRLHGVPENRRPLGPPARMPVMRARGLLRLLAEPARDRALPRDHPPDRPLLRARRGLALVLPGRDTGVTPTPRRGALESRFIDLGGPVHFADFGGDGPTMVLVHGLGGSAVNWMAVGPGPPRRGGA